jgi:hypothetical protein
MQTRCAVSAMRVLNGKSILDMCRKNTKIQGVRIKYLPLIFLIPLLLSGCASSDQYVHFPDQNKIVEDPGKGRIYVIRPKLTGLGIFSDITDDGQPVGCTARQGFLCWERVPGSATIAAKTDNTNSLTLDVQAGEVYYILQTLHFGWIETDNTLELIDEQKAKDVLKKCKPPFDYQTQSTPVVKP